MSRFVVILLCLFVAVACVCGGYFGYTRLTKSEDQPDLPTEITCQELLDKIPANLDLVTLTDFQPGKHFVSYDDDDDGQWERVFVPLFPLQLTKLDQNYHAVIVRFDDVRNKDQLSEKVKSQSINAQYWSMSQQLDRRTYWRMARDYSSMNFRRNVILYSGSPPARNFGRAIVIGSGIGLLVSMLVGGWQAFALMIAGIKHQIELENESEEEKITNRAGLPTDTDSPTSSDSGDKAQTSGYSNQLITEKYLKG